MSSWRRGARKRDADSHELRLLQRIISQLLPLPTLCFGQGGRPYVAVFLRKERDWAAEGETEGGDGAEARQETMQLAFPEVITSLDEIYHVGTLAQVRLDSFVPGFDCSKKERSDGVLQVECFRRECRWSCA